jgi:hypothetical protein
VVEDGEAALDRLLDSAGLLGLDIRPAWRAAVRAHLHTTLTLAELVMQAELPDAAEPAPVFVA